MRVLIDEHLDIRLYRHFGEGFEAQTTAYRGWKGMRNGALLRQAAGEYDAFVTNDRGIPHQQNVEELDIRVVVLIARSNNINDLAPLVPAAQDAMRQMKPGEVCYVEDTRRA